MRAYSQSPSASTHISPRCCLEVPYLSPFFALHRGQIETQKICERFLLEVPSGTPLGKIYTEQYDRLKTLSRVHATKHIASHISEKILHISREKLVEEKSRIFYIYG